MGEVTKIRRTLIVPNQAIATYVTQWTYDSHNRLGALPESGKVDGWRMPIRIALYRLEIGYDNIHRIVSKKQHLTQQGVQFNGTFHVV